LKNIFRKDIFERAKALCDEFNGKKNQAPCCEADFAVKS
jgi:hypothetical protein